MSNLIILIIYILGVIASIALYIKGTLDDGNNIRLDDMGFFIFTSLFSWITFILLIFTVYGDIILIRNKKYKN